MKMSERTLRISAASVLALFMVGTAYALSGPNFLSSRIAGAGTAEELLKAYAEKDTDTDGLPDWQEALYGTDPNKADTDGDGVTDGEAAAQGKLTPNSLASQLPGEQVGTTSPEALLAEIPGVDPAPGSITEQFSRYFLQEIVNASSARTLSDGEKQQLVLTMSSEISRRVAATLQSSYNKVSVRTDASVNTAQYALAVEEIVAGNTVPDVDVQPLQLMEQLVQQNDTNAAPKLVRVSNAYSATATQLRDVQVPPVFVDTHVALVRAYDELGRSTRIVSAYEQDPLATMGALSVFSTASKSLATTFTSFATALLQLGEPREGEPGAFIVFIGRASQSND